jgi:hypothetical protein
LYQSDVLFEDDDDDIQGLASKTDLVGSSEISQGLDVKQSLSELEHARMKAEQANCSEEINDTESRDPHLKIESLASSKYDNEGDKKECEEEDIRYLEDSDDLEGGDNDDEPNKEDQIADESSKVDGDVNTDTDNRPLSEGEYPPLSSSVTAAVVATSCSKSDGGSDGEGGGNGGGDSDGDGEGDGGSITSSASTSQGGYGVVTMSRLLRKVDSPGDPSDVFRKPKELPLHAEPDRKPLSNDRRVQLWWPSCEEWFNGTIKALPGLGK